MVKAEPNNLDKVLADVLAYLHPEFLNSPYKERVNLTGVDKKKLNEYYLLLSGVDHFYKRIIRYEVYFEHFYPISEKIRKAEALECHIYSYLESFDILRNKIRAFLGVLKNDLKRIASNKQEIDKALTQFIDQVEKTFDQVKKYRHPHHHSGYRFVNGDIVDAAVCATMLKDDFPFRNELNIPEVEKRETEHFEKAKNDYVQLARKNNEQITGLINTVFEKNRDFIYEILNIKSLIK